MAAKWALEIQQLGSDVSFLMCLIDKDTILWRSMYPLADRAFVIEGV